MSTPETEVQKVIDDTKETIASLEGDVVKTDTYVKSVWEHYEIYFAMFIAFVIGAVVGHFV